MKRQAIVLLIALMLIVPIAQAVRIDGLTNFNGPAGGNVRFQDLSATNQISIVDNIYRYNVFSTGGSLMGNIGFDCSTGTVMLITQITSNLITYTVTAAGASTQYVYFDGLEPVTVNGVATDVFNAGTGILTLTSVGNTVVTIRYSHVSSEVVNTGITMAEFLSLLAIILIFGSIGKETMDIRTKLIAYTIVIAVLMVMAAIFAGWGY